MKKKFKTVMVDNINNINNTSIHLSPQTFNTNKTMTYGVGNPTIKSYE
jgi:hypothetical protein